MNINWEFKNFSELTLESLYDIMRLRQEVFVLEQNCPYLDADGKDIDSYHLLGYLNSELVAYLRIVNPGISFDELSFGRILTSKKIRGNGVGKLLMEEGIKQSKIIFGNIPNRISAQKYLKKFYNIFGFKETGKEYLEDGIPHIEMIKK